MKAIDVFLHNKNNCNSTEIFGIERYYDGVYIIPENEIIASPEWEVTVHWNSALPLFFDTMYPQEIERKFRLMVLDKLVDLDILTWDKYEGHQPGQLY